MAVKVRTEVNLPRGDHIDDQICQYILMPQGELDSSYSKDSKLSIDQRLTLLTVRTVCQDRVYVDRATDFEHTVCTSQSGRLQMFVRIRSVN